MIYYFWINIRFAALVLTVGLVSLKTCGQFTERERPDEWKDLILGGRFMDRYLPMPNLGAVTKDTWGASNVVPRDINNGIESPKYSYWGGNTLLAADGKYHLMVCRWLENSPKGHMAYHNSIVVHAVSDNLFGPFKVVDEIGPGHNPTWYIAKDGKYVIYVINGYFISDSLKGPWKYQQFDFDIRNRDNQIGGNYLHNLTFSKREDGSFLMVNRKGDVWFSQNGLSTWNRVTDKNVYPPEEGKYEDPVIWKTNIQYHLIVNDWLGRIAWYLRSKNGVHWKAEPGEAYLPGISVNENGNKENWFKYERIRVFQDEHGRATAANFAVIDTLKHHDLPNDNHSSKLITIPLAVGRLLTVMNQKKLTSKTKTIKVKIEAEEDFDPYNNIDLNSLRFGASEQVNFGRGAKLKKTEESGKDLILVFNGAGNGLTDANFAGKLLGKDKSGKLLFGYSRLPEVNYIEPILSARLPKFFKIDKDLEVSVVIENFGQASSKEASLEVIVSNSEKEISLGSVGIPPIEPFGKSTVKFLSSLSVSTSESYQIKTIIKPKGGAPIIFKKAIDKIELFNTN